MIRVIAKLFAVTVALTAFFPVAPLYASQVTWLSSTGIDGNGCTATNPCATFQGALNPLNIGGQINCLNSPGPGEGGLILTLSFTVDCAGLFEVSTSTAFQLAGTNQTVRVRNLTINGSLGGSSAIKVTGSGTLIIENCVFENMASPALDIEPNGAFNLVITNSRVSNSGAGVLIKPAAGGSVKAIFDRVTITNNSGGGVKSDATNGPIQVDISNSTVSNNAGNGLNAVAGGSIGTASIMNLSHDVIALNGSAGIQANGAFSAALVDTTLIDSNATGAISAINSGRVTTYGTNRVVGIAGSGFTGTVPLQ